MRLFEVPPRWADLLWRTTAWQNDRGVVQLSVAVLDERWETLREVTRAVGPFDDAQSALANLRDELVAWMDTNGLQLDLV